MSPDPTRIRQLGLLAVVLMAACWLIWRILTDPKDASERALLAANGAPRRRSDWLDYATGATVLGGVAYLWWTILPVLTR